jgi:small nuclear ribonucleoprotein B and B'
MGRGLPAAPPPMGAPMAGLSGPVRGVGGPAPGVSSCSINIDVFFTL